MNTAEEQDRQVKRRFVRNVRWQFVANAGQALFGGLYLVALGRLLGPAEFGVFSAIMAVVSVAGLLLEMRLQEVVARDFCLIDRIAPTQEQSQLLVDLFVLETLTRLLPAIGIALAIEPLISAFNLPVQSSGALWIAAAAYFLSKSGSSVSTGLLRVLSRTDHVARCMTLDWGLRLVVTVLVGLLFSLDLWKALWIALVVGCACNLLQIFLAVRSFEQRCARLDFKTWKPTAAMSRIRAARRLIAANLGVSASDLMAKDLDIALISSALSADKVGLYKMAKSFVQVLWRAIDPFYLAVMPEIQRLWQQQQVNELKVLLRKTSMRLTALALSLVAVGISLVWLLGPRLLGPGYEEVPKLMAYMSPWLVVCAPLVWGGPVAIAVNRPELATIGSALGLVLGLAAFVVMLPPWGLIGAAAAWNITLISGFAFTAWVATNVANARTARHPH